MNKCSGKNSNPQQIEIEGLNCKTPEEVLYNFFSGNSQTIKVFNRIIKIYDPNINFAVNDKKSFDNILNTLLNDIDFRDKFFKIIESVSQKVKGGKILQKALDLFKERYNIKEKGLNKENMVLVTREKLAGKICELLGDKLYSEAQYSMFKNLEGKITNSSLDLYTVISLYKQLKNKNIPEFNRIIINNNIWILLKMTEGEFKSIELKDFVENRCDGVIRMAIDSGWITLEEFKSIELKDFVENRCDGVIRMAINSGWITSEEFKSIELKDYVKNKCDLSIFSALIGNLITSEEILQVFTPTGLINKGCSLTSDYIIKHSKNINIPTFFG